MTTVEARNVTKTKDSSRTSSSRPDKSKPAEKASSPRTPTVKLETDTELHAARVTKHDRILTLLSQREGATILEMMDATDWQQHSVRGFLAGTVKRKLGFALTSSKAEGELRRYRIETKRGR